MKFLRWLTLRDTPDDVAVAQFRELSRHVPMVYAVVMLNSVAATLGYLRDHPWWVGVGLDLVLLAVCAQRMLWWRRASRMTDVDPAYALRAMRRTVTFAMVLAFVHVVCAALIRWHGIQTDTSYIAILTAATIVGCVFCLMYLPQATLAILPVSLIPYIVFYAIDDQVKMLATMIEVALVSIIMAKTQNRGFRTFTQLIRQQSELEAGRREAERLGAENARVAHIDSLTGLPNRRFFFAQLDMMTDRLADSGRRFAVGLLDLDRFKPVNDSYGHAMGDRLLVELGRRLADACGDSIIVARLGGDEFGLLLLDCDAAPVAQGKAFCDLVSQPMRIDDLQLSVGASCGLAVFPDAGLSARELFDRSDHALYHAKAARRGSCILFTAEHETHIRSGQVLEAALHASNFEDEMDIHFLPIVDTHSMATVGVEALARWTSPVLGIVPPDRFIPAAEGLGMMRVLTPILFRKALAHARALPAEIGLSFNLSANDIVLPETIAAVLAVLDADGYASARITMEITETAVIRDFDLAVAAIEQIRARGIKVALDDFGTGSSSLTHLRRLPLDSVKVDREFAAGLGDPSGDKIVAAISNLCQNLGLSCVIEGIENAQQLLVVRQFGYRLAQGYYLARPMPITALTAWLDAQAMAEDGTLRLSA